MSDELTPRKMLTVYRRHTPEDGLKQIQMMMKDLSLKEQVEFLALQVYHLTLVSQARDQAPTTPWSDDIVEPTQ